MNKDLVSCVSPFYNMEKKMDRFIESILNQTYTNLELIFVDDGSTDKTLKKLYEYQNLFERKGMIVKIIHQKNAGLGAAIGRGLKEVTGEYLIWPDPDDWLSEISIEKRLLFLQGHPEYAIVSSNGYVYRDTDLEVPLQKITMCTEEDKNENQFELLLNASSIFYSGCHMIRFADFLKVNPDRYIFPALRGQNYQMLLPVYYSFKRFFLDECLYHYVIYEDSMSRGDDSLNKKLIRQDGIYSIIRETLMHMNMSQEEKTKYLRHNEINDAETRLVYCAIHQEKKVAKEQYRRLKENKALTIRRYILYLRSCIPCVSFFYYLKEKCNQH